MTITSPGRQKVAQREMEKMFKAIAAGDARGARAAAVEHVERAAAVASSAFFSSVPKYFFTAS